MNISDFRSGFGMEMPWLIISRELWRGSVSLLDLLDLSVAFDDHNILLCHLMGMGLGATVV